jgi:zinc/manganese transport system substrate-binding protein
MSAHKPTTVLHALLCCVALVVASVAQAEIRVITTTPSLADIVKQVGGEEVRVESLMSGRANGHNVIPRPSFVMKLRKADLFVHSGLDAEPWLPNLVHSSRKIELLPGGAKNLDVSTGIRLLEVPAADELTRAMGDIHVYGNPHYILDPMNGAKVGRTLAAKLGQLDPDHAATFESRAIALEEQLTALTARLADDVNALGLCSVVTAHRTWSYFLERFQIKKLAELEPKPGIAAGPRHIASLAKSMKQKNTRLVLSATYGDVRSAARLAKAVEGRHVILAQEVNALPDATSYISLFETNVKLLVLAAQEIPIGDEGCP